MSINLKEAVTLQMEVVTTLKRLKWGQPEYGMILNVVNGLFSLVPRLNHRGERFQTRNNYFGLAINSQCFPHHIDTEYCIAFYTHSGREFLERLLVFIEGLLIGEQLTNLK